MFAAGNNLHTCTRPSKNLHLAASDRQIVSDDLLGFIVIGALLCDDCQARFHIVDADFQRQALDFVLQVVHQAIYECAHGVLSVDRSTRCAAYELNYEGFKH